jgi:hypothetical protein
VQWHGEIVPLFEVLGAKKFGFGLASQARPADLHEVEEAIETLGFRSLPMANIAEEKDRDGSSSLEGTL